MADDAAAVLDAPVDASVTDSQLVDTSQDTADQTDSSTDDSSSSAEELRGPQLWREFKSSIDAKKELTPAQVKAIRTAIHEQEFAKSKFPDGLNKVDQTIRSVQQLADDPAAPIDQVINETLQERQYFRELDDLFTNGKPEFVARMAEAEPNAFQAIAPAVFQKFSELNPEGFSAYIAQTALSHFNGNDVPLQFKILSTFLPQLPDGPAKDQVIAACETIFGTFEGLKQLAAKPVTKDFKPQTPEATQQKNGPDPALDLSRREWNLSVQREGVDMVLTEAAKVAGKQPLNDKEKQAVVAKVAEELDARLSADRKYGEAMQGYLRNGNRTAYIQRIQSERRRLIPGAVRRAVDDVIAARPKVQPKTDATKQQPAAQRQQNGQFQGVQYRKIGGHPKTLGMMIDLNRTTQHMLLGNKAKGIPKHAYIKGEDKPVTW